MNHYLLLLALFALCYTGAADHEPGHHYEEPEAPQLDYETVTQLIHSLGQHAEEMQYEQELAAQNSEVEELAEEEEQQQQDYAVDYVSQSGRSLLKRSPKSGRRYVKYVYRRPLSKASKKKSYVQQAVFVPEEPCDDHGVVHEVHELAHDGHVRHTTAEESYGYVGSLKGKPGVDYPNYTEIPMTSFTCADKHVPGFYADLETGCQVFHICYKHRRESFLCPVGTIFNQPILACDYWYNGNCSASPEYYGVNEAHEEIDEIIYVPNVTPDEGPDYGLDEWVIPTEAPEYPEVYTEAEQVEEQTYYEEPVYPTGEPAIPIPQEPSYPPREPVYPVPQEPSYPPQEPAYPTGEPAVPIPQEPSSPPPQEPIYPAKAYKIFPVKTKVTAFKFPTQIESEVKISSKPFNAHIQVSGFAPMAKGVDITVAKPVVKPIPVRTVIKPVKSVNVQAQFSAPIRKPIKPIKVAPIPVAKPAVKVNLAVPFAKAAVKVAAPLWKPVKIPVAKAVKVAALPMAKVAKAKTVMTKKGLALALLNMLNAHKMPYNNLVRYGGSYYHY